MVYSDKEINDLLSRIAPRPESFSRHYNQLEEFFLLLDQDYEVPHLPIHHDIRQSRPSPEYLERLKEVLGRLFAVAPQVFWELTYMFDPGESLKPCFFKLYRVEESQYLYLLRLDLMCRPQIHVLRDRGNNDLTARYSSRQLFLEASFIPLAGVVLEEGRVRSFTVKQAISNTWIGETGRGYFAQGIWMDNELTKFFSKIFLPQGKKTYPFYPYVCKYKTLCQNMIRFSPEARKLHLPYLHRALKFIEPVIGEVENSMRQGNFSEDNPTFRNLKRRVPPSWYEPWEKLHLEVYLNHLDMREFRVEN